MIMAAGHPESIQMEGRNGEIWRKHIVHGRTQADVAAEYGLSQQRVSEIIRQVRATIPNREREEVVQDSLELLSELQRTAVEIMEMAAAPVTVGKDGEILRDPEQDNAIVRDFSGKLNALKAALSVNESVRRLLGADAAKGLDVNVSGAEVAAATQLAEEAARRVAGDEGS